MLIQFRFKNFKSFKEDTILDLSATRLTEHSDRVISLGNEKLLPAAAIFGANASGKSNVMKAFRYMVTYVIESFAYGGDENDKKNMRKRPKLTPFLFNEESRNAESSFEVYFIAEELWGENKTFKSYNYGFTIDRDGISEEWLNSKAKTAKEYSMIFYRNREALDLTGLPEKSRENIEIALEKETLIVSLGAKLKIAKLKNVRDWFYRCNFADFGNPYENAFLSSLIPDGFADDPEIQKDVIEYFSAFDPSIIGFHVEVMEDENENREHIKIDALHRMGKDQTASIPLEEESGGTLKMFALYPVLRETLQSGGVLFVDELNSRLHPLLVRNFLITFLDPGINTKHAQIIFTTHDSWQLSNNLLRRDEIWFTEKDEEGISVLYSLADFLDEDGMKIRKDENYEKNYLLGKYGAIPSLKSFHVSEEN